MNKQILAEIIQRLLFLREYYHFRYTATQNPPLPVRVKFAFEPIEATPDEIRNALADIGLTCTSEHVDEILNGPKEERH